MILQSLIDISSDNDFQNLGEKLEGILLRIRRNECEVETVKSELSCLAIKEIFEKLPNKDHLSNLVLEIEKEQGADVFKSVEEIID